MAIGQVLKMFVGIQKKKKSMELVTQTSLHNNTIIIRKRTHELLPLSAPCNKCFELILVAHRVWRGQQQLYIFISTVYIGRQKKNRRPVYLSFFFVGGPFLLFQVHQVARGKASSRSHIETADSTHEHGWRIGKKGLPGKILSFLFLSFLFPFFTTRTVPSIVYDTSERETHYYSPREIPNWKKKKRRITIRIARETTPGCRPMQCVSKIHPTKKKLK